MKTKIILLITLNLFFLNGFSQECGTPSNSPNQNFSSQILNKGGAYLNEDSYCINIKFHIVRETNGTGGFNPSNIETLVSNLNQVYNPVNIHINNIGYDYIDNSNYYNLTVAGFNSLIAINNTSNSINFYLVNSYGSYAGQAQDIPSTNLVVVNDYAFLSTSEHELGHCLNLYHTHHGTWICERDANTCIEVDGNSNTTCGDYVEDTPADPCLYPYINNSCSGLREYTVDIYCNYTGDINYHPDTSNIMSYSRKSCRINFSKKQGQRMRDALKVSPLLQQIISNSCTYIVGPNEICTGSSTTYTIINIPIGATINWGYPANSMYIISGQGTPSCTFGSFTSGSNNNITSTITYNGTNNVYMKNINILSGTTQQVPTIIIAPDNPFNLTCCGQTYTFNHTVCENNCTNIEWNFNVYYQSPQDYYGFARYGNSGYITAQKNTFAPLIVGARARNIPVNCGSPSAWSNEISRYYGTVSSTNKLLLSTSQANYNSEIPLSEYYSNIDNNLYIETVDLYAWLESIFGNRNLDNNEVEKIKMLIKNEKSFNSIKIQIYNFYGVKIFDKNFKEGSNIINLSNFENGVYFIKYNYGGILNTKTIIKN
ncbi:MAG: T9SS type A sorting domain-containing protein [Lutibacter sp.]